MLTIEPNRNILGWNDLQCDHVLIFIQLQVLYAWTPLRIVAGACIVAVFVFPGLLQSLQIGLCLDPGLFVLFLLRIGEGRLETRDNVLGEEPCGTGLQKINQLCKEDSTYCKTCAPCPGTL